MRVHAYRVEQVPAERYEEWQNSVFAGFGYWPATDTPGLIDFFRRSHPHERAYGVRDESSYLATAAAIDLNLTLPGGTAVPVAGVTGVTVDSTVRRRGLLSAMLSEIHRSALERGFPLTALPSSEWPIYERFGYGPAVWVDSLNVDVPGAGWRSDVDDNGLQVRRIAGKEARDLARILHTQAARTTPGEVTPPQVYWDRFVLDDPLQCRVDMKIGVADDVAGLRRCVAVQDRGLAMYRIQPAWTSQGTPRSTLLLTDLLAIDDPAAAALWRYLLSVDLVTEVHVPRAPTDHPLRWWVADPRHIRSLQHDSLWLRPLDVPALLQQRQWVGDGRLTISIHDKQGFAEGTYALEVENSHATCRRSSVTKPDLEMDVSTLGSILLGGNAATGIVRSGRIVARDARSVQRWDAIATPERSPFSSYLF